MEKVRLVLAGLFITLVAIMVSAVIVGEMSENSSPSITLIDNQFPEDRKDGLQIFLVENPNDFPVVMEIKCENTINAPEFQPLDLGKMPPNGRVAFPVLVDATVVGDTRPVEPQCRIKKWVRWN